MILAQPGMEAGLAFILPSRWTQMEFLNDTGVPPQFRVHGAPFTAVDREAEYRQAWAHFEARLKEEEGKGAAI